MPNFILMSIKVGIIGGGQLARMLIQAGKKLDKQLQFLVFAENHDCVKSLADTLVTGSLHDAKAISIFCEQCDVVTYELENINVDGLKGSQSHVIPDPSVLEMIQDKGKQKEYYTHNNIPTLPYSLTFPTDFNTERLVLKTTMGGYNGQGVYVFNNTPDTWEEMKSGPFGHCIKNGDFFIEPYLENKHEVAVIVARSDHSAVTYPVTDIYMKNGILESSVTPSRLPDHLCETVTNIADRACAGFSPGLYAVEMFVSLTDPNDTIYVNEISPRVHNSGHYTIEGTECSQFEQLLRIMLGKPLGSTALIADAVKMFNILGPIDFTGSYVIHYWDYGYLHDYGKSLTHPNRKIGHVTYLGTWPKSKPYVVEKLESTDVSQVPEVGIIMGSINDSKQLEDLCQILDQLEISYEKNIVSAHRTSARMIEYAQTAEERGIKVIIAAAGGAAHLPGMTASETTLPVIGIPIRSSTLDGLDSLLSIVQMPRGIPVGTMSIGGAENAGLYAARILALSQPELRVKLKEYSTKMKRDVIKSNELLNN